MRERCSRGQDSYRRHAGPQWALETRRSCGGFGAYASAEQPNVIVSIFQSPALAATLWFGMPHILMFVLPHSSTITISLLLCFCRKAAFTRLIKRQGPRELRITSVGVRGSFRVCRMHQKILTALYIYIYIASQPIVGDVNVPCQHQLVARWRGRFPIAALRSTTCATRPRSSSEFAAASRDVNAL